MGNIIRYHNLTCCCCIGFNAYDSSILIGKTEKEADIFINDNVVLYKGSIWEKLRTYRISHVRVVGGLETSDYCPSRLNVHINNTGIIIDIRDIG